MVTERLSQVDAQIAALQRIRDALRAAIDQSQSRLMVCPAKEHPEVAVPPLSKAVQSARIRKA
jgi:hypothetical protein